MVLAHVAVYNALNFFSRILIRSEALVYNSCFFFRTAVLRKLLDIRFSYKHCNFSRGCVLVMMASKTMTRSNELDSHMRMNPKTKGKRRIQQTI